MNNIFQIGNQVSGPAFIGRKALVEDIRKRVIYNGTRCTLSFVGLPRIGKSSLVANALDPALLREAGIVYVFTSISSHESFETLWQSIVASIWRQLKMMGLEDEIVTMAYEEYTMQPPIYAMIKEPLEFFFEAIKKNLNTRIVLVLDEFDKAAEIFLGKRHYFEFIRDISSKTCYSISTITISRRQLINIEADAYGNSTFQHIFDSIQVHGFNDADMEEYWNIFDREGAFLSDENREALAHYAGRSPYLLSIFGSNLCEQINRGSSPDVHAVYYEKAVNIRNYFDSIVHQMQRDESLNKLLQLVVGPKYDLKASDLDWYIGAGYIEVAADGSYYVISESCTRRFRELSVEMPIWPIVMDREKRLKVMLDRAMKDILGSDWMYRCRLDENLCAFVDFSAADQNITREWKYYHIASSLLDVLSLGDVVKFIRFYWDQGIRAYFNNLDYSQWKDGFDLLQRARNALAHNHEDYLQERDIHAAEMFCLRLAETLDQGEQPC
ncbi:MAG: ATP-binding protein [Oscillospiraceae bacterium]|nr:ATP-binding protein [Oscillospiraceae bacterium]